MTNRRTVNLNLLNYPYSLPSQAVDVAVDKEREKNKWVKPNKCTARINKFKGNVERLLTYLSISRPIIPQYSGAMYSGTVTRFQKRAAYFRSVMEQCDRELNSAASRNLHFEFPLYVAISHQLSGSIRINAYAH